MKERRTIINRRKDGGKEGGVVKKIKDLQKHDWYGIRGEEIWIKKLKIGIWKKGNKQQKSK